MFKCGLRADLTPRGAHGGAGLTVRAHLTLGLWSGVRGLDGGLWLVTIGY